MKIKLSGKDFAKITVADLAKNYSDNGEGGVAGYDGRLDIRPAYQREFVYPPAKRDEVVRTVHKNFPLNVMYWSVKPDGKFEMLDGQQRTISVCSYIAGDFSVDFRDDRGATYFHSLPADAKQAFLDYALSIYVCEGEESERLDWFKIINIAGEVLTAQELRNAIYTGPWLSDAKRWFSKTSAPAAQIGGKLVDGSPIRQAFLEKALDWISRGQIEEYMSKHQLENDADELWKYFQAVVDWVNGVFTTTRKEMKGLAWGEWYNLSQEGKLKPVVDITKPELVEEKVSELYRDEEVSDHKGIYKYILTGEERHLSIRAFAEKEIGRKYVEQGGICPVCGEHFELSEMEADHKTPWSQGGKTAYDNLQMLCRKDNREKSDR
jgi:hypothetical protein